MKPPAHDHPDLTAYALGELVPADAARVRNWLAQSPEAMAEFKRIQQTVEALQAAPALPKRALHPHQRETVLAMGQTPASTARPKNVVPFLGFRRPAGSGTSPASVAWRLVKYAAAACLVAGAFMMGQKTAVRMPVVASNDDSSNPETFTARVAPMRPAPDLLPATMKVAEAPSQAHAPTVPAPVMAGAEKKPSVTVAAAPAPARPMAVAEAKTPTLATPAPSPVVNVPKAPQPSAPAFVPVSLRGFAQAAVSAEAELKVQPESIRRLPVPHEFAGVVLASPQPLDAKPAPAPRKPESQPALVVHSLRTEIATCPWDSSRRLMRVVLQVPVDQPGIQGSDADYKLIAKFDPFHVQGFRLVTEKHLRATGTATQATRFAWYEIIPTRNYIATAEKPVTLGSISVEQPRGTSPQAADTRDMVDRGQAWTDAREDFVFETAMIGWNMLLNGTENVSGLNSKLVLDLAEKTRGEDARGERTKFINAVKLAQRAVGM
jgi:hypothetical protein